MGVADTVDELRCNAWRLARRTRRWSRGLQHDAEDLADRLLNRRNVLRLSRTTPLSARFDTLRDRYLDPAGSWLDERRDALRESGRDLLARWQDDDDASLPQRIRARLGLAVSDDEEDGSPGLGSLARLGIGFASLKRLLGGDDVEDRAVRQRRTEPELIIAPARLSRLTGLRALLGRQPGNRDDREGDDAAMLGQAARTVVAYQTLKTLLGDEDLAALENPLLGRTTLVAREVEPADDEPATGGKLAKLGLGYAGLKALFGRNEEEETNRGYWWLGFGLAALAATAYVATRRTTRSLQDVSATAGMPLARFRLGRYPTPFGELAYRTVGEGQPIVLLHSILPGADSNEWQNNVDVLAQHFQVFALDWLGFGLSDKPDLEYTADRYARILNDFLRDVVKDPAVLVGLGHSAGIATHTAALFPKQVAGLVLVNPVGKHQGGGAARRLVGSVATLPFLESPIYYTLARRSSLDKMVANVLYQDPALATNEEIERYYRNAHQPGASHPNRDMMAGRLDVDLLQDLTMINVPILLVAGRQNPLSTIEDTEQLARAIPRAELTVCDDCALMAQTENALRFNRLLIDRFAAGSAQTPGQPGTQGQI